jgi:hypothetical protein
MPDLRSTREEELSVYISFWSTSWHKNVSGRAAALQMTWWGDLGRSNDMILFSVQVAACMQAVLRGCFM